MAGSFIAMRGRRTISSQLFVTLSDRLLAVAHAETSNSAAWNGTRVRGGHYQVCVISIFVQIIEWIVCFLCSAIRTKILHLRELSLYSEDPERTRAIVVTP